MYLNLYMFIVNENVRAKFVMGASNYFDHSRNVSPRIKSLDGSVCCRVWEAIVNTKEWTSVAKGIIATVLKSNLQKNNKWLVLII